MINLEIGGDVSMHLTNIPQEFKDALPILEQIREAGFEAYFVGGSVRDTLLKLSIHDVDIATSAYPAEVKEIFEHTVDTGIQHGTVMVLDHGEGYETTTFRTESGYQDFRRPDKVEFVRSLKEDLKRRDLTINAFALAPDGEVIDMFSGMDDLKNKTLRAVGDPNERFHEDALRMMRTVRFASQLDFSIEENTLEAIRQNAPLLEKIAVERIQVEWVKLLLGKNVLQGLKAFLETGLYQYCPQLANKQDSLEELASLEKLELANETAAWTLLTYSFDLDQEQIKRFLKAWKTSNELINEVQNATFILQQINKDQLTAFDCYKAGENAVDAASQILDIFAFALSSTELKAMYRKLPIKDKHELQLNGKDLIKDLNIKPSKEFGEILNKIEHDVVSGLIANDHDMLLTYAQKLVSEGLY